MTLEWPWPILRQGQIWKLRLFYRKKWKQWIFLETIEACDLKVGRYRQLIDFMKVCEYWRTSHYLTLARGRVHTKIQTGFSQKLLGHSELNFVWKLSGTRKWKFINLILVTWPRWPPCPYMVKTLQKSSSPEPVGRFSRAWYVASGTPAHHSLYKWWLWSALDLFYGKVKFGNLGFSIGKSEKSGFFRNYRSLWPESW